jgi:hypothetical protein
MKTLSLRRMAASAAVVALGSGALVLGGGTAAQAATGSLSVTPAAGTSAVSPTVKTSAPCSAGATEFFILMKGGATGFEMPAEGQLIQPPTNNPAALANLSGASGHQTQFAFDDVRADASLPAYNATTGAGGLKGTYTLEVTCTDGLSPLDTFTGQVTFTGAAGAANTYVFVAPTVATTTSLAVSPASPVTEGDSVTLTATVGAASGPAVGVGTVQFKNGAANVGPPVNVAAGSAQLVTTALPQGSLSLTAEYSGGATATATYPASVSSPQAYQVNPAPASATFTALSVTPATAEAFAAVTLQADVTRQDNGAAVSAGTVQFFDGAASLGAPITLLAGSATLVYSNFAVGPHPITATFVPADPALLVGSTSLTVTHTATVPSCSTCTDPQTVVVTVPVGTLSITTPYSPQNPFDLGTMALSADGLRFSALADFPAAGDRLTITDTRAGQQGWTASAGTTDFVNGANSINGQNLSLINVVPDYIAGNALQFGSVTVNDVVSSTVNGYAPGAGGSDGLKSPPANPFASAAAGNSVGTVDVRGVLKLIAPTSTPAGLYTATLTFTVG